MKINQNYKDQNYRIIKIKIQINIMIYGCKFSSSWKF
jgi:hypothetical protein